MRVFTVLHGMNSGVSIDTGINLGRLCLCFVFHIMTFIRLSIPLCLFHSFAVIACFDICSRML